MPSQQPTDLSSSAAAHTACQPEPSPGPGPCALHPLPAAPCAVPDIGLMRYEPPSTPCRPACTAHSPASASLRAPAVCSCVRARPPAQRPADVASPAVPPCQRASVACASRTTVISNGCTTHQASGRSLGAQPHEGRDRWIAWLGSLDPGSTTGPGASAPASARVTVSALLAWQFLQHAVVCSSQAHRSQPAAVTTTRRCPADQHELPAIAINVVTAGPAVFCHSGPPKFPSHQDQASCLALLRTWDLVPQAFAWISAAAPPAAVRTAPAHRLAALAGCLSVALGHRCDSVIHRTHRAGLPSLNTPTHPPTHPYLPSLHRTAPLRGGCSLATTKPYPPPFPIAGRRLRHRHWAIKRDHLPIARQPHPTLAAT